MPRKHPRSRVERGLYREGKVFWACATPIGSRQVVWERLGPVGVMEARRRRDEFVVRTRQEPTPAASARATTFADVAGRWLEVQELRVAAGELRPRTVEIYEQALRVHVLPELGGRPVRSITADDLVAWHRRRRAGGSTPDSVHAWWTPLRLVLAAAVRDGVLASNPAERLLAHERPKAGQGRQRFLTADEMRLLLQAAGAPYRMAIGTALFSGLRLGELLGLTWADVDFKERVIRVRHQLDRRGERQPLMTAAARRDVILMDSLGRELREYRVAAPFSMPQHLLFASATGRTVGHRNVAGRGLRRASARAGLDGVTFHVLRHTFASVLIGQGHDPVFVSRQLGHANPAITLRVYAHLFDGQRHADRARELLDREFQHMLD